MTTPLPHHTPPYPPTRGLPAAIAVQTRATYVADRAGGTTAAYGRAGDVV